jgi:hypothetical protein
MKIDHEGIELIKYWNSTTTFRRITWKAKTEL